MRFRRSCALTAFSLLAIPVAMARYHAAATFNAARVNDARTSAPVRAGSRGDAVLRAQILLDRAFCSPGEIDGYWGENLHQAVLAFQRARNLPTSGEVDAATWAALNVDSAPVLVPYTIAASDVAGPFVKIPEDMLDKAKLPSLGYESAAEALGERFHSSPKLLALLNPGRNFEKAGEAILVPQVSGDPPGDMKAASLVVQDSTRTVQVFDAQGKLLASYPASTGSEHDPLPVGDWKINGRALNPEFHYDPKLFWDAKSEDTKAVIPPGPNNPVGVAWIDLSKPHYGIHGTPEPAHVGKTQSHGCIRVTNWAVLQLAALVRPGLPAHLEK